MPPWRPRGHSTLDRDRVSAVTFPARDGATARRADHAAGPSTDQQDRRNAARTVGREFGAPGWIRTSGLPLRRRLLYPLSYGRFANEHNDLASSAYQSRRFVRDPCQGLGSRFPRRRLNSTRREPAAAPAARPIDLCGWLTVESFMAYAHDVPEVRRQIVDQLQMPAPIKKETA